MKVYSLEQEKISTGQSVIAGVFNKPKDARKFFDKLFKINTKHQWSKRDNGARYYQTERYTWIITEWRVQGKKYGD